LFPIIGLRRKLLCLLSLRGSDGRYLLHVGGVKVG
jgi:hypothetical protein